MTKKLYDEDSHLCRFRARMMACVPVNGSWAVVLNQTAFFPEGGGQAADTGRIGLALLRSFLEDA